MRDTIAPATFSFLFFPFSFLISPLFFMHGKVIRNTGSWYEVRTDDGRILECKVKGNFRLRGIRSTNPVAVGDHVEENQMIAKAAEGLSVPHFAPITGRVTYVDAKTIVIHA